MRTCMKNWFMHHKTIRTCPSDLLSGSGQLPDATRLFVTTFAGVSTDRLALYVALYFVEYINIGV
jgi:hypothetical protein